jgi:alcohol dehydrogenase
MNKFYTVENILVEVDALTNLASHLSDFQAKSVLLVTDNFLLNLGDKPNGLLYSAIRSLEQADISVTLFSDIEPDPTDTTVLAGVKVAKAVQADLVLSIGGGSSLDVAKVISVLAAPSCQQQLSDLFGIEQVKSKRLPLVLVPTTAGTGSEVTPISIITTGKTTKAGIVDKSFLGLYRPSGIDYILCWLCRCLGIFRTLSS